MSVTVKAYLKGSATRSPEIRRFTVDNDVTYEYLSTKIAQVFPSLRRPEKFTLEWKDADIDLMISFSSDEELMTVLGSLKENVFRIIVTENKEPKHDIAAGAEGEVFHPGVVCAGCDGSIRGPRFKCIVCPDYDLCKQCEDKGAHPKHKLVKFSKPEIGHTHDGFGRGQSDKTANKDKPLVHLYQSEATNGKEEDPQADYERDLQVWLEREVLAAFEEMLEDMGLTAEKAKPLRDRDIADKRKLVVQYMKRTGSAAASVVSVVSETDVGSSSGGSGTDPEISSVVERLQTMGFDNDDDWLTKLVEAKGGDINYVLDVIHHPEIIFAFEQLQSMGFVDDQGWLTHLVEAKGGDINSVLDVIYRPYNNNKMDTQFTPGN